MKNSARRRRVGRGILAAVTTAAITLSGVALLGPSASAHDGHDHDPEPGAPADALDWANYDRVLLTKDTGEPIDLAVLPDGRVLHTARNGDVRVTDPSTGVTTVTNTIPVYANSEDGLQSVAIDPDFAENGWVYLVYSPPGDTPQGSAPERLPAGADEATYWDQWVGVNRLARFQWTGDGLDLASEQVILDVEVQRGQCCHVGADIDWDGDGNLYLTTGDNTPAGTPGAGGFTPINEAPGMNPGFDARRGAGNTNDLRGKILRIAVQEDGTYTIPEGNLFAEGTEGTRPEIFIMGVRNPFRFDVDPETNTISWGDYGPDATSAVAATAGRGPMGLVEFNITSLDEPHNSGWPYVTGDDFAYNDWDYATATPGEFFDPANLVNTSKWNTGLEQLPPAKPATLYYGDDATDQPWPELTEFGTSRGQGPMGGPVYHYDAELDSDVKLPEHWDGKVFMGEFSQDYVAAISFDEDLAVTEIEDFFPFAEATALNQPPIDNPMDIEFGPDGALYMLDYGDGFFRANPDAGLYRLEWAGDNRRPQAAYTATPTSSSSAPLTVEFDAADSVDPDGDAITYEWDFDGDGNFDAEGITATHTYDELGLFTARLRVTDEAGKFGLTSQTISVGNQSPEVSFAFPENGGYFDWGQGIPFQITTNDAEDGTETVCDNVRWTYGLGHDEHAHPEASGTGCEGLLPTLASSPEHGPGALLYGTAVVTYTDQGANGLPPTTGEATLRINPFLQEAEHAEVTGGEITADAAASAGNAVTGLGEGDSIHWTPVSYSGIDSVITTARGEGQLQFRWNTIDAEPFATADVSGADWADIDVDLADAPEGSGELFVTATGDVDLDALDYQGTGIGEALAPEVSGALSPAEPNGPDGTYNTAVTLTVAAEGEAQLASAEYSLDGGTTWTPIVEAYDEFIQEFGESGEYEVQYRGTDENGTVSEVGSVSFVIDLEGSGEPETPSTTDATVAGSRVTFGAPGVVDVAVAGEGGVPTGEVVVTTTDGTQVGSAELVDGAARVALDTALPVGTHTLTASYGADGTFLASSDTVRITVVRTSSSLIATMQADTVKPAIAPKVNVAVSTATGIAPSGDVQVAVLRNGQRVAQAAGTLDAAGQVVVTLPKQSTVGRYTVQVSYPGTADVQKSSAQLAYTVRN